MSRLEARFADLRSRGRTALIPYLTAGDPGPGHTVPLLHALVGAGADVLELGIPFSDPMADGPVIQAACERALAGGTDLARVLDMVREFRRDDPDTPVVLMGYLNPVEAFGAESFATAAAAAGVDGVLLVDMPPEESGAYGTALRAAGIDVIYLVSPTTGEERLGRICELAGGFVYYVSLKGVTGAASLDTASLADRLDAIRARTPLPVGVGFGIRDAATARAVGAVADAVVVGSALVERLAAQAADPAALPEIARDFLGGLRAALDSNTQTNRKQAAE